MSSEHQQRNSEKRRRRTIADPRILVGPACVLIFVARVNMAGLDLGTAKTEMPFRWPGLAEAPILITMHLRSSLLVLAELVFFTSRAEVRKVVLP